MSFTVIEPDPLPGRAEVMTKILHPDSIKELRKAQIIIGIDEATGNEFLMFGRDVIKELHRWPESETRYTVFVEIRQATNELEALCAAVEEAKGHHEYEPDVYVN
jgi:hypothetical protein